MNKIAILLVCALLANIPIAFAVQAGASSDSYTLIAIEDNGTVRLFKQYDNVSEEISYPDGIFESTAKDFPWRKNWEEAELIFNSTPRMISWNGEYFLMDNMFSLIKYDGQNFEAIRYGNGGYSAYRIKKMIPADKYWILIYNDAGTPREIIRIFSGENFKDFHVPPSPIWLLYILLVLIVLFIYRLLKDLKKRKG